MDQIIQFIIGISGDIIIGRWLVIILFASSVFAIVMALYFLIFGIYNPVRKRLYSISGDHPEAHFFRNTTAQLGNYFVVRERVGEKLNYDRERLIQGGYHTKNSLSHYFGIKILLTIGLPILIIIICSTFFPKLNSTHLLLLVSSGIMLGFIGPSFYLDKKVTERKRVIKNAFPDVVDQLIVCTEAGLGLDAGLQRVAKDTVLSSEIMSYELGLVNAELRAGVARDQALKNLVTRTGVEEIRGLTSALAQSMRFGTSIGNTLRVFAEDLRDKRMQRAEEEAAKLAVKMLFPLAFCFFPGIFIVILGPAVISIYAALSL
ncbi:MAG: hypothetical protein RIQ94_279 [Pseudomonadota bacterium]|jgi:tight adherence protein C